MLVLVDLSCVTGRPPQREQDGRLQLLRGAALGGFEEPNGFAPSSPSYGSGPPASIRSNA